jgi:hypothetical protein
LVDGETADAGGMQRREDGVKRPVWVLVHSPSVSPLTWAPVAECLEARGHDSLVPSLLNVAEARPPFWPRLVEDVNAAVSELDPDRSVFLVVHSNAGLFVPLLVRQAARPVRACLFVDAALPVKSGATPAVPPQLLEVLRAKAGDDGTLPPWSQWWAEDEIAPLFPDQRTRLELTAEEPKLPLNYYEQSIPAPAGWDDVPCGYIFFGEPYDEVAAEARNRGWPVQQVPGLHLHQLVDPDRVTDTLIEVARQLSDTRSPGSRRKQA